MAFLKFFAKSVHMFSDALAKQKHRNINLLKVGQNHILSLEKLKSWGKELDLSFWITVRKNCHLDKNWLENGTWPSPFFQQSLPLNRLCPRCGMLSSVLLVVPLWWHGKMHNKHEFDTNKACFQIVSSRLQCFLRVGRLCTFRVYLSGSFQMITLWCKALC